MQKLKKLLNKMKIKTKKIKSKVLLVNRCLVLNKSGKILLLQRSLADRFDPDMWEFPGGKMEEGQDTSHTLEREVLEETGIMVVPVTYIAYTESQLNTTGRYKGYTYVLIVGIAKHVHGSVVLSKEHKAYKWVTEKEALQMNIREEIRKALIVLSKTIKSFKK